jgi:hypothetical protein
VAVPATLPRSHRAGERLAAILADSGAPCVLASARYRDELSHQAGVSFDVVAADVLALDADGENLDAVGAGAPKGARGAAGDGLVAPLRLADGTGRGGGDRYRRRGHRGGLRAANQYLTATALTNVPSIDVAYAPSSLAIVFASAAFGLTLLGAIPPAIRAARLNIVDAVAIE